MGFFFSSFPPSSPLLPPLWPPRPLESKVIQIQSDHLHAASLPVAAMERSKVTCSIQVCLKKTGALSGRPPLAFSRSPLDSLLAGFLFSSSSLMLLSYTNNLLALAIDKLPWCLKRVSSSEERLGCFLEALLSLLPIYFLHVLLLSPRFLLGG